MRFRKYLIILLALLLCTACTVKTTPAEEETQEASSEETSTEEESSEEESPSEDKSSESSESESSEESSEPEPEPKSDMPLMTEITSLKGIDGVRNIFDIGDGTAAITTEVYSVDDGQILSKKIYWVDVLEGQILKEVDAGTTYEEIKGIRKNGEIITLSYEDNEIRFYDEDMQLLRAEAAIDFQPVFDVENDSLYSVEGCRLIQYPVGKEKEILLDRVYGAGIKGLDTKKNRICFDEPSQTPFRKNIYAWDYQQQKLLSCVEDVEGDFLLCSNCMLLKQFLYTEEELWDELQVFDIETGEMLHHWKLGSEAFTFTSPESPSFLIAYNQPDNSEFDQLYLIDPVNGLQGKIEIPGNPVIYHAEWMAELGLWLVQVRDVDLEMSFWLLNPTQLEFTDPLHPVEASEEEPEPEVYTCGEYLTGVRERADALEEKYPVRIYIGNDILNLNLSASYRMLSSEDPEYYEDDETMDYLTYNLALDELELFLEQIPENYYEQFRDWKGEGGLHFVLPGQILNDNGGFLPGGFAHQEGPNFYIVICNEQVDKRTLYHEFWHTMENRITQNDPNAFAPEKWNAMNPPEFAYGEDFEAYNNMEVDYEEEVRYTIWNDEDPYFANSYSKVTPMEDRATLIEFMVGIYYNDMSEMSSLSEVVLASPHLKAKLDYMTEETRKIFGTAIWENVAEE